MIRTVRGYLNPLIWALVGWALAVIGNVISEHVGLHFHFMLRVDEIITGLGFGFLRWLAGEWQMEYIYHSRAMETQIRNALQVLYSGEDQESRRQALHEVIEAFEHHRPVHPNFRIDVEEFLFKYRQDRDAQRAGTKVTDKPPQP